MKRTLRLALSAAGLTAVLGAAGSGLTQTGAAPIGPTLPMQHAITAAPLASPVTTPLTTVAAPTTTSTVATPEVSAAAPTTLATPLPTTEPAPAEQAPADGAPADEVAAEEVTAPELDEQTTPAPQPVAPPQPAPGPEPILAPATVSTPSTPAADSPVEAEFIALLNNTRTSIGVAPLYSEASLHTYAQAQARAMANAGSIYHSNISALLNPWSTVAENVGFGPTTTAIHDTLVASPGHWTNLANPSYTNVGVGVAIDANGRIYTAHVFAA